MAIVTFFQPADMTAWPTLGAGTIGITATEFDLAMGGFSIQVLGTFDPSGFGPVPGTITRVFVDTPDSGVAPNFEIAELSFETVNIESVTISSEFIRLLLAGNDRVLGSSGADTLIGANGNDTLCGGLGNDRLDGGAGFDFADYSTAGAAVVVDLGPTTPQNTGGAGIDTLVNIEGVIGSSFNDVLLRGFAARAVLQGGAGNDRFHDHNFGNDAFHGGTGSDTIDYTTSGAERVTVNLVAGRAISVGGSRNTLVSIENVVGSAGNDTLIGDTAANRIDGGDGNDVLVGGRGRDTMTGGLGADRFDFDAPNQSPRGPRHDTVNFVRTQGDKIDLSTVDADTDGTAGNQAFRFIGTAAFSGVDGQLRFSGGLLQGDTNGDKVADIEIRIAGALIGGDVIL